MYRHTLLSLVAVFMASVTLAAELPPGAADPTFDSGFALFPSQNNPYLAAAVLPDGSVVLAGPNLILGVRLKLTHIFADGRYDYGYSSGMTAVSAFTALAYQPGGGVLVGGAGISFGKNPAASLVRLNLEGGLDPSFTATNALGVAPVKTLAILPDSGVLVARVLPASTIPVANRPSLLIRLYPDGAVDPRFQGHVFAASGGTGVQTIHVLDDGRMLVGGSFVTERTAPGQLEKLVRLLPDGEIDLTYEEPPNVTSATLVNQLVPVEDGLLVSVRNGTISDNLIRVHSDGSEDGFFSNYRLQPAMEFINGIVAQADGHLILGGTPGAVFTNSALVRILPNGTEDEAFPSRVDLFNLGIVNGLVPFSDGGFLAYGSIVEAGVVSRPGFVRVLPDGTTDESFGRLGVTAFPHNTENAAVNTMIPMRDGLFIAGNFHAVDGRPVGQVAKLRLNGALDTGFFTNTATGLSEAVAGSRGFELPDGRIVLASTTAFSNGKTNYGGVIRLLPDGRLDDSFHFQVQLPSSPLAVALQPDGKVIVGVHQQGNSSGALLGVVRLLTNGVVDGTFRPLLPVGLPLNTAVTALTVQTDGKIVIATQNGFVGRYDTSGKRDPVFEGFPTAVTAPVLPTLAALSGGDVYVSGYSVTTTNGLLQLFHWNPDGTFDRHFNFPLRGRVDEVRVAGNDRILVRGQFSAGSSSPRIFRCFPDGGIDYSFALPDRLEVVHAMAVAGDRLYISAIASNTLLSTNYAYDHVARYSNRIAPFTLPVLNETLGHFVTLNFFGPAGAHYYFDASSDLLHWVQIADEAVPTNGIVPLLDDLPKDTAARFYRARPVE